MEPDATRTPGSRARGNQQPIYVHKVSRHTNVTVVPNEAAQNAALSFGARGLLVYMLSMPTDWVLNEADLVTRSPGGRDHLRTLLRELEAAGHLVRTRVRNAAGHIVGSSWEVWDEPQTGKPSPENPFMDKPQSGRGLSPRTEKPSPENPSMVLEPQTENPSPENPSEVTAPPPPPISPRTENPSTVKQPLTEKPSPENPSTYKRNIETKTTTQNQEPPLTPPPGGASPPNEAVPSIDPDPPKAARRSRRRAEAAATFPVPDFAEPHRPLLRAWWKARLAKHPRAEGEGLTSLSIGGLTYAHERGVLPQFLEHAAEAGWLSLGFNGHRRFIEGLINDLATAPCHSESGMVRFGDKQPRPLTRQAEAVGRAAAIIDSWAHDPQPS